MSDDEKLETLWAFGHWKRLESDEDSKFHGEAIKLAQERIAALEEEAAENARIIGMSGERELALRAENERLIRKVDAFREDWETERNDANKAHTEITRIKAILSTAAAALRGGK